MAMVQTLEGPRLDLLTGLGHCGCGPGERLAGLAGVSYHAPIIPPNNALSSYQGRQLFAEMYGSHGVTPKFGFTPGLHGSLGMFGAETPTRTWPIVVSTLLVTAAVIGATALAVSGPRPRKRRR